MQRTMPEPLIGASHANPRGALLRQIKSRDADAGNITVTMYLVVGEPEPLIELIDRKLDFEHQFRVEPMFANDAYWHPNAYDITR